MLITSLANSQLIPIDCANPTAVQNKICCPSHNGMECGGEKYGTCENVSDTCHTYGEESLPMGTPENFRDNRFDWPTKLFTFVCKCKSNYGGVACSECKFGYEKQSDGTCVKSSINNRTSINSPSFDWPQYKTRLLAAKNTNSTRYKILIGDHFHPITIYNLFIWIHHYTSKDNINFAESDGSGIALT